MATASKAPFAARDTTTALMRHSTACCQVSVFVNSAASTSTITAIAALAVRGSNLVPAVVGLGDEDDLLALGVLPEPPVAGSGAGAKVELAGLGGDGVHRPAGGLLHQRHPGRHGGGDGCTDDAAYLQVRPLVPVIQRVGHRQLPLAVEGFGHGAGCGG